MFDWLQDARGLVWTVAGVLSLVMFVGSIFVIPALVARMPADYFLHRSPPEGSWRRRHPVARVAILLIKNLLGLFLIIVGLAMILLPGQGVLTILMGLVLVDYPKKREFELFIVRRPLVRKGIQWIRKQAHRPPLLFPPERERAAGAAPPSRSGPGLQASKLTAGHDE